MKAALIYCLFFASCAGPAGIIQPKITSVKGNDATGYRVNLKYKNNILTARFDRLPDSVMKGKRITLYPLNGGNVDSGGGVFKFVKH